MMFSSDIFQNTQKNNCCNICGKSSSHILYKDLTFDYVICKSCAHVFQSNRKEQTYYIDLPYFVGQEQVNKIDYVKYDGHVRRRASYIHEFIQGYVKDNPSILDIGCSYGGVLFYLGNLLKSNDLFGVTPDYDEKTFDRYAGIKFERGTYENPIKNKFEFVTLVHTLEHFISPISCLTNVYENLTDDGILYLEVPNFYWESFIIGQIYNPAHISYFTKNDLLNILKYCGFEVLKIKESRYWGNIKIIAKKNTDKSVVKINRENWILKLIKDKMNKVFLYPIYRVLKRHLNVKAND